MTNPRSEPSQNRNHNPATSSQDPHNVSQVAGHQTVPRSLLDDAESKLGEVMFQFMNFDHGYLKVRRSSSGDDLHLTWTWSLGAHSGSYVYVRVSFWEITNGLHMLARKVLEVDDGSRQPSPDKFSKSPM